MQLTILPYSTLHYSYYFLPTSSFSANTFLTYGNSSKLLCHATVFGNSDFASVPSGRRGPWRAKWLLFV